MVFSICVLTLAASSLPPEHDRIVRLEHTARFVGAAAAWAGSERDRSLLGEGILIADMEIGGGDVFHPDLFYPDGGSFDFEDSDGDGVLSDRDRVDLDGDGVFESELSIWEPATYDGHLMMYLFSGTGYQPNIDWVYVDANQNAARDSGEEAGFDDTTPAFGEPIFAGDDLNQNDQLDVGEKLFRLGSSKVRAIVERSTVYERGRNLSSYRLDTQDVGQYHATSVGGILAGGWPGLRRFTGMAPAAEILFIIDGNEVRALETAESYGAQIVLWERGGYGEPMDGSTAWEQAISDAADRGIVQINPAGNFAALGKVMEVRDLGADEIPVRLTTRNEDNAVFGQIRVQLGWIGGTDRVSLGITIGAERRELTDTSTTVNVAGVIVAANDTPTRRGNTNLILTLTRRSSRPPFPEEITLHLSSRSGTVDRVRGVLQDDVTGAQATGVRWLDYETDLGTVDAPAMADNIINIGAYLSQHDESPRGSTMYFSAQGPRIDGERVIDLAAPGDLLSICMSQSYAQYISFGATSGAAAHAAGVAALVLSSGRATTHDEMEALLTMNARKDEFTGDDYSEEQGYGKLDVSLALFGHTLEDGMPPIIVDVVKSASVAVVGKQFELTLAVAPDTDGPGVLAGWDVGYDLAEELPPSLSRTVSLAPQLPGSIEVVARAVDVTTALSSRMRIRFDVVEACTEEGCGARCCLESGMCGDCPIVQPAMDAGIADSGEMSAPNPGGGCSCAEHEKRQTPALLVLLTLALLRTRRIRERRTSRR